MSHCIKIIVSVSAIQTCAPNQFQCANKKCIPYVWKCDHDNDCGDNSDEPENCKTIPCRPHYLKCNSTGRCIPETWKCDGDMDCGINDHTDEPKDECSKGLTSLENYVLVSCIHELSLQNELNLIYYLPYCLLGYLMTFLLSKVTMVKYGILNYCPL